MCRILFYNGAVTKRVLTLIDYIVKAGKNDPLLYKASKSRKSNHSDGWGYIIITPQEQIYYRSTRPIYEDREEIIKIINLMRKLDHVTMLIHVRAASEGGINILNTQPISFSKPLLEFFIAHNGTLDKRKLVHELHLNIDKQLLPELSDTYIAGTYLLNKQERLNLQQLIKVYRELAMYTKTAFNTVTLFHTLLGDKTKRIVVITNYYKIKDRVKEEYYKLYIEENKDYTTCYSSTIHYLAMCEAGKNVARPLPNNTISILEENTIIYKGFLLETPVQNKQ